jgi:Cu(I)/Ag(I) efflux system membrane fusion protein
MLKLPSGHPPMGEMTPDQFARWHLGLPASAPVANAGSSCGNCGMSMAAMAAGEPCEHEKK